jgi:uncharacterized protein
MKIAIMSDSHDRWDHLEKAIQFGNSSNCKYLLFAGDLIAPPGISVLQKFNGKVILVWGNNEGEKVGIAEKIKTTNNIELHYEIFDEEIEGTKIFMNHYPRPTELAAQSGQYDLCIHGHTHIYREEKTGKTNLVNPGEIQGFISGNVTFVIFDTTSQKIEKITL